MLDGAARVEPRERRAAQQDLVLRRHAAQPRQLVAQLVHRQAARLQRQHRSSSRNS